ncbi:cytochrome P450 [Xylaria sp. FL0933]|nr:cytochrome P450 [Xylaria sp. FL0933]
MAYQEFPFAREKANDPPPLYAKLRREDPVSKVKLPNGHFAWLLTRHEDIREALSSGKLSVDPHAPGYPEIYHHRRRGVTNTKSTLVTVDGHEHARLRGAIDAEFTPEAVEKLRPLIHSVVDEALDVINRRYVKKERPFDLVEEFAAPVPMRIICRIVGVPAPDVVWLSQDTALGTEHPRDAAEDEKEVLVRYVQRLVDSQISGESLRYREEEQGHEEGEDRKRNGHKEEGDRAAKGSGSLQVHEGLISKLVRLRYETSSLSRDEIAQLIYVVLTAGNAALINSISLGVLTLFENESELHKVRRNPLALAPGLAAECLRYNSTSALDCRRAVTEDLTLAGTTILKGEGIICAVQSADRDDRAINRPDVFDPQRKYPVHDVLGLGCGAHRCLGEHLAKAELEVALGTLFARFPGLKLHGSAEELEFTAPKDNMGVLRLPVSVDPNVQLHRIHMPD